MVPGTFVSMHLLTAVLAASLPIMASGQAQLLPAGEFAARDGRPGPGKAWRVSDPQGTALAAALSTTAARTPVVIDYEHQTLSSPANGQPAPAAGWIKSAAWRAGEGLFADVEWTAAAKARIDAGEYRFISPVITYDASGAVTGVVMAALTNFPALLGMDAVVAQLNARFSTTRPQEPDMQLLVALLTAIGLPATTTEADALAAVAALKARPQVPTALTAALGLAANADEPAAVQAVAALKGTDSTALGLITTLQGQVAALNTQLSEGALVSKVDGAIAAGKFAQATREQLLAWGRKDMASLTAVIDAAPVIAGLSGQSAAAGAADAAAGNTTALTAQQTSIAKALGLDPKAYLTQLQAAVAA